MPELRAHPAGRTSDRGPRGGQQDARRAGRPADHARAGRAEAAPGAVRGGRLHRFPVFRRGRRYYRLGSDDRLRLDGPLMPPDLRSWMRQLDEAGELIRIDKPVDPRTEMGALLYQSREKALLFENLPNSPGWRAL